jgi:hypothetical protein
MTNSEFSNAFTVLLNSYSQQASFGEEASKGDIVLNEYEKSLYLTKAQEEIVTNLYNGKNPYGDSFEGTEEMRRYLDALVSTKVYSSEDTVEVDTKVSPNSVFYKLPDDLAFITMEQVKFGDKSLGCFNGSFANVYPVTQDEYSRVKNNPFRGPTRYKVLRLDAGEKLVELVSKYGIEEYLVRYMKKPTPIILESLPDEITIEGVNEETECALNSTLHNTILERAVQMALQSKGISVSK